MLVLLVMFYVIANVLSQNHVDCLVSDSVPVIDMVVATDGAWARYEVEQFISLVFKTILKKYNK